MLNSLKRREYPAYDESKSLDDNLKALRETYDSNIRTIDRQQVAKMAVILGLLILIAGVIVVQSCAHVGIDESAQQEAPDAR